MIGGLISALFNFILGLLSTILQIIVWPLNQIISAAFPDISSAILTASQGITALFNTFGWALDIIPPVLKGTIGVCFALRLVITTSSISTHALIKVWNVLQKIKFW